MLNTWVSYHFIRNLLSEQTDTHRHTPDRVLSYISGALKDATFVRSCHSATEKRQDSVVSNNALWRTHKIAYRGTSMNTWLSIRLEMRRLR